MQLDASRKEASSRVSVILNVGESRRASSLAGAIRRTGRIAEGVIPL